MRNYTHLQYILNFVLMVGISMTYSRPKLQTTGNHFFGDGKIESLINLPLSFKNLSNVEIYRWKGHARLEIESQYEQYGYFDVVARVRIDSQDNSQNAVKSVHIMVNEGKRYLFDYVRLVTTDSSSILIKPDKLRIKEGDGFNREFIWRDKRDIEKVYGNAGYANRKIRYTIDIKEGSKSVSLTFFITPNQITVLDTLIIYNTREGTLNNSSGVTRSHYLRDLFALNKSDTVGVDHVNAYKRKLKSTRVFSYIRVRDSVIESSPEKFSALRLNLEERVPGRMKASLFFESIDGFGIDGQWTHKNILGRFYQGKMGTRLAQKRQSLNMGLASPLLFGTLVRFDNDLDLDWRQDREIDQGQRHFEALYSATFSYPVFSWGSLRSKLQFESTLNKLIESDTLVRDRIINSNLITSFSLRFLDNVFSPTKGSRWSFIWGNGGPFIDDNNDEFYFTQLRHNWLELNSAIYVPVKMLGILALRGDGGIFFGKGRTNSRRFYLGGRSSVRNEQFQNICPDKDTFTDDVTGLVVVECNPQVEPVYFLTSLELRTSFFKSFNIIRPFHFIKRMQIVPFIDYGNVWDKGESIKDEGKGLALGLGLRLPVTFLQFRFDYAVGWDNGPDYANSAYYIDLTQAF